MVNAEETKRTKAKNLRYKKPFIKDLNLDAIKDDLWDIQDACEDVHWYTDSDDGSDSLVNALDGDEDEAYEFKMAFADLCAECERMQEDLQEEWVPDCFDIFFVAAGAGDSIRQCFKIYQAYVGLRTRYDSLKAAIDVLRDQNTGHLQVVREIESLYEAAAEETARLGNGYALYTKEWKEFDRYTNALPPEAWIA